MDRFSEGTRGNGGSDDPSRAREHVRNAEENRDALAAQSRRTQATAPAGTDQPIGGNDAGAMNASGLPGASEDASRAAAHAGEAERNRDALADENQRVRNTTPPEATDR